MAIFTAANAFDTESFIASGSLGELFNFGQVVAGTADTFALDYSDEEKSEQLILTGVFGDYVDDFPTSGTITDAAYTLDGLQLFSMSGLSMPVEQFTAFVRADDILQLFQSLLSGADEVYGSDGDDVLMGFAGNDVIDGGDGLDRLAGGDGDDRLVVSVAPVEGDVFDGGNGIDTLQFMAAPGRSPAPSTDPWRADR